MLINGIEINIKDIFKKTGESKTETAKELCSLTGLSLEESTKIANEEITKLNIEIFKPTQIAPSYLEIDDNNKLWAVCTGFFKTKRIIYQYSDIINFELLEDGEVITKGGSLGKAVLGGAVFGGAGAIVGAMMGKKNSSVCTNLQIRITVNDPIQPAVFLNFITMKTKKSDWMYTNSYKIAQYCLSLLKFVHNQVEKIDVVQQAESGENSVNISIADEILKFKNLLDSGIITEEEFLEQKQRLLKMS